MEQGLSWEVESDEYLLMSVRGIASISVRAFLLHLCVYRWGPERELMKNMCCAGSSHSLVIAVTLGHMLADMHQDWQLETVDWYPTGTEVSFIQHCNQHVWGIISSSQSPSLCQRYNGSCWRCPLISNWRVFSTHPLSWTTDHLIRGSYR